MKNIYLKKSSKPDKKFMVYVDGKTIHFGAAGMSDYTIHKDKERMGRYNSRHQKRENWTSSGIKTAGFWSKWLLWNKPSFSASKSDIEKRFGVKIISGWVNLNSKRSSPKRSSPKRSSPKRSSRKKYTLKKPVGPKYERCVLAVKAKQPKRCVKGKKWSSTGGCVNPFAVCTARVGRYN